jgi:hypothetical protein
MRVASELGQHLGDAIEGRFGVDHPLDPTQFGKPAGKGGWFLKVGKRAEEAELAGLEGSIQRGSSLDTEMVADRSFGPAFSNGGATLLAGQLAKGTWDAGR